MNVLPYGDEALLVETDGPPLALAAACDGLDGVREVVPAARTVLLVLDDASAAGPVAEALRALGELTATSTTDAPTVELRTVYDGADLAAVAAEVGLEPDGLVRAHCEASYTVAFCGFVPGFAYLDGLPERLHVPRLTSPRTRVPAGSVGIAGEFTGVYPRPSPGGWRLLGRTEAALFDPSRTPPALLAPGTRVRFRPVPSDSTPIGAP